VVRGDGVALVGCLRRDVPTTADSGRGRQSDDGRPGRGYPVTVTDCAGGKTTFTSAPRKIVTSNASSLELLLRLGVGDKVIGTGFPPGKGTLPAPLDAEAQQVPALGTPGIPKENLLASGADLYIDTFASMEGMGAPWAAPDRGGVQGGRDPAHLPQVHRLRGDAEGAADRPVRVEDDITTLGAVTGTAAKAKELVDGMRQKVDAVRQASVTCRESERPTYFFFDYDAGTQQPSVVCNRQIANAIITLAAPVTSSPTATTTSSGSAGRRDLRNPDWIQLGVPQPGSTTATPRRSTRPRSG